MLRQGLLPQDRLGPTFEVLERNATALARIVDDVLDLSRIASGKLQLHIAQRDVSTVITESVESVEAAARTKGVRLDVVLPDEEIAVNVDGDRFQQVLWNLLSNGIKFTPAGGRVEIAAHRVARDGLVEIAVSDTGVGIDPNFLGLVFERFQQADNRLNREHGGLGLGLAIAQHLVELHNGTIRAASPGLGAGTVITVQLPVAHGVRSAEATTAAPTPRAAARLDGRHVLIVDDDADALLVIRQALESAGARVSTARSADDALTIASRNGIDRLDALLSDVGLPRVDGYGLLARIRALSERHRRLPAAALTALARPEDRERSLQAGFQRHLAKPIDPGDLIEAVSELVAFQPTAGPAAPLPGAEQQRTRHPR
jgi:CheY-like chemotaxis protein